MRQHAHPMRRNRRRRLRAVVISAAAVALVAGAVALGPLMADSPAALTAGENQALGADRQVATAPPSASASDAPSDAPAGSPATPPDSRLGPGLAMAGWPPATPLPVTALTGYVWPIAHPRLTLPYGPTAWGSRVVDGALFHDGVDLATFCGDRIMATHDGVVLAAGRRFDNVIGWVGSLEPYYQRLNVHRLWAQLPIVVVIDDGNTYRSVYAHFWKVVVKPGQHVHAGQLIGYEGMSGHATGCHLHYGLFSPFETATFGIEPKVAKAMRLPTLEIARVDPLQVLPYRKGLSGPPTNLGSN